MLSDSDPLRGKLNGLLGSLPPAELAFVQPNLHRAFFWPGEVIQAPGQPIFDVYFIQRGLAAVVFDSSSGVAADAALVGRSGLVGAELSTSATLGTRRAVGRLCVEALRMPRGAFIEALSWCPTLSSRVARYHQLLRTFEFQSAACAATHDDDRRLARWLLTVSDAVPVPRFPLNAESQAAMLGLAAPVARAVHRRLARAGLIRSTNGQVTVLSRERLEQVACDCYRNLRRQEAQLIG